MTDRRLRFVVRFLVVAGIVVYLAPTVAAFGRAGSSLMGATQDQVIESLRERRLQEALTRSLAVSAFCGGVVVPILLVSLYTFVDRRRSVQRLLLMALLLPLFIPETTHAFAMSNFVSWLGLGKGALVVGLAEVGYTLPFCGIIVLIQYGLLPRSLRLASQDLALSRTTYVLRILGPLMVPVALSSMVFAFLLSFNEFTRSHYLQSREMYSSYLLGELSSGTNNAVYVVSAVIFTIGVTVIMSMTVMSRRAVGK